jgi:hypothetical protein
MLLLVPCDVLRPRRPDEHFAPEAAAAREAGWDVGLVDHDDVTSVPRLPEGEAVYRGWMFSADRYRALADTLAGRGVTLRTTPEHYRRAHELPGWYDALAPVTPESVWTVGDGRAAFDEARGRLGDGPVVLRDYTKSAKHEWDTAAFVPDVADAEHAWRVASRLREVRDDDFTGGFVLRRFERFTGVEARTWWVGGVHRLTTAHPDTPGEVPADVDVAAVAGLVPDLPFVTVDLARREDGAWRVVELGDGQVSDRPTTTAPADLIAALA